MTFASVTLPVAALRWRLDSPAGPHTDALVAGLVGAGVGVESIAPGASFRLRGSFELLDVLAAELKAVDGFKLEHEPAPTDKIVLTTTLAPTHTPRRSVVLHGPAAASMVVRAIERGLTVATVGANRWEVAAASASLVAWLAAAQGKPEAEVMQALGFSPESIAAEDAAVPVVSVSLPKTLQVDVMSLPNRKTTSTVARDDDGDIKTVIQIESDTKQ